MRIRGDFKGFDEVAGRKGQDSPLSAAVDSGRLCFGLRSLFCNRLGSPHDVKAFRAKRALTSPLLA